MKEFINKLIGRLEELDWLEDTPLDEIINEFAEEYKDGWIPCSERLPEEADDYLVTQYNKNAIDDYCDGYRVSTIFFDDKNKWWDDIDYGFGWDIIAWQPRPQPYKEEGV